MNTINGKVIPINDNIFVHNMNFSEQITASGIVIRSDDGKLTGIKPRWAQVWAVGPRQTNVNVGDWVLVEHGRWSRGIEVDIAGSIVTIRTIDPESILLVSDQEIVDEL